MAFSSTLAPSVLTPGPAFTMPSDIRDEEHEMEALLESDYMDETHDPVAQEHRERVAHELKASPKDVVRNANTDFLDGLRGLAAVFVFIQHLAPGYLMNAHEWGFGQDGKFWYFCGLPFIRVIYTGGNSAVVVFFVLSGYVLSIGPFRKMKAKKINECRRGLIGALVRRPIRLYVPPITISFIFAMMLHIPGPLVLPLPWCKPQEGGLLAEVAFFWEKLEFFSLFREHASNMFSYPYNVVMWTLPIELKGSLLIYSLLGILSLGISGPDPKVPLMAATMIFGAGFMMLQRNWKWSMVSFLWGMALAIVDTWPIGEQISNALQPPDVLKPTTSRISDGISRTWNSVTSIRIIPGWLSRRISSGHHDESVKGGLFAHLCFWVGWYFLSQPSHAGDASYSANTPGWIWLHSLIPKEYDREKYYRYWESWGALLLIYGILRIGWLQNFFRRRTLKFFGFVSFMLYLIHSPFFRILPDRLHSLFGGSVDPAEVGTFWDQTWTIPDIGPYGLNSRFLVALAIGFPSALIVAYGATIAIDQPSVRLGKWITTKIGLEKPRANLKVANEGSLSLPR